MATISSGVSGDSSFMNLKEVDIAQTRPEVRELLVGGEEIVAAFQTVRDQVLFTNKRIIVVNVQGLVGKKIAYSSYPYSRIQNFTIETAGVLDIDSELLIFMVSGLALQFDFRSRVDMGRISQMIAAYVL